MSILKSETQLTQKQSREETKRHTPGEWIAHNTRLKPNGSQSFVAIGKIDVQIHRLGRNGKFITEREQFANAVLIAAAPELFSALERIIAAFDEGAFVRNTAGDIHSDWAIKAMPHILALRDAQTAIAKARGAKPVPEVESAPLVTGVGAKGQSASPS